MSEQQPLDILYQVTDANGKTTVVQSDRHHLQSAVLNYRRTKKSKLSISIKTTKTNLLSAPLVKHIVSYLYISIRAFFYTKIL